MSDPAMFTGQCDEHGVIRLDFPMQQRAFCKKTLAGQCIEVSIALQGQMKSRKQECGFHAMIKPWALGEGHRIDDLKHDLLRAVFGEMEHVNPLTGEVRMVLREPHTSRLTKAQYSELIERTLEEAAQCGVILEAPSDYRERKEREQRKPRKTQAA